MEGGSCVNSSPTNSHDLCSNPEAGTAILGMMKQTQKDLSKVVLTVRGGI